MAAKIECWTCDVCHEHWQYEEQAIMCETRHKQLKDCDLSDLFAELCSRTGVHVSTNDGFNNIYELKVEFNPAVSIGGYTGINGVQ